MKLFFSITVLASSAFAVALPAGPVANSANVATAVTICNAANGAGNCETVNIAVASTCFNTGGTQYDNNIKSIGVQNGFRCRLWDSTKCNGDSTPDIYAPGANELPLDMQKKATSLRCYQN